LACFEEKYVAAAWPAAIRDAQVQRLVLRYLPQKLGRQLVALWAFQRRLRGRFERQRAPVFAARPTSATPFDRFAATRHAKAICYLFAKIAIGNGLRYQEAATFSTMIG
jgi:hypothetical protein